MQVEALVQPGAVDVERVGVLHGELAHPQQAALGARLVAELGLNLVPDLGKLFVAAQFLARNVGHDLFVGHAQAEVGALAVLEAEHVVAHHAPASAGLPHLARIQRRQVELLADGVHLLAHDAGDLEDGPLGEEEVGVDSSRQLADVSGAHQELVAGDFGVGGCFTKGGDKQLGPALHRDGWIPVLKMMNVDCNKSLGPTEPPLRGLQLLSGAGGPCPALNNCLVPHIWPSFGQMWEAGVRPSDDLSGLSASLTAATVANRAEQGP